MVYTKNVFGKEENTLAFADVANYFANKRAENDHLQFLPVSPKDKEKLPLPEIVKKVAALANTGGGLLVLGSPTPKSEKGSTKKWYEGQLTTISILADSIGLVNAIGGQLQPAWFGLDVLQLVDGNEAVVLLKVEEATKGPLLYENIAYCILDGQNQPAPYTLLASMFQKALLPVLEGYLNVESIQHNEQHYAVDLEVVLINQSYNKHETGVYFTLETNKGSFMKFRFGIDPKVYRIGSEQKVRSGVIDTLVYGEPFKKKISLLVYPSEIINEQFKVSVELRFGGHQSPLKKSIYQFDLSKMKYDKPFDIVVSLVENQPMYNEWLAQQAQKETLLKEHVKR